MQAHLQDYRERAMARAAAAGRSAAVLARTTKAAAAASWRSDTGASSPDAKPNLGMATCADAQMRPKPLQCTQGREHTECMEEVQCVK